MSEGIRELDRLWREGNPSEPEDNPAGSEILVLLAGAALAFVFRDKITSAVGSITSRVTTQTVAKPAGVAGATAAATAPAATYGTNHYTHADICSWARGVGINCDCAQAYVVAKGDYPSGPNGLNDLNAFRAAMGAQFNCSLP